LCDTQCLLLSPSGTALAAIAVTVTFSQRFARLVRCERRNRKHQKREAYSKLHAKRPSGTRRSASFQLTNCI